MKLYEFIKESESSDEAKKLGLTYAGYGKWKDKTGKTVAKTVNNKLVFFDDKTSTGHQSSTLQPSSMKQNPSSIDPSSTQSSDKLMQLKQFAVISIQEKFKFLKDIQTSLPHDAPVYSKEFRQVLGACETTIRFQGNSYEKLINSTLNALFLGFKFQKRLKETNHLYKKNRRYSLSSNLGEKEYIDLLSNIKTNNIADFTLNLAKLLGGRVSQVAFTANAGSHYSPNDELADWNMREGNSIPHASAFYVPLTGQILINRNQNFLSSQEFDECMRLLYNYDVSKTSLRENKLSTKLKEHLKTLIICTHEVFHTTRLGEIPNSAIDSHIEEGITQYSTKKYIDAYMKSLRQKYPDHPVLYTLKNHVENLYSTIYYSQTGAIEFLVKNMENPEIIDELIYSENLEERNKKVMELLEKTIYRMFQSEKEKTAYESLKQTMIITALGIKRDPFSLFSTDSHLISGHMLGCPYLPNILSYLKYGRLNEHFPFLYNLITGN